MKYLKKLIALALCAGMLFALAACGKQNDKNNAGENGTPEAQGPASPLELLTKVWDSYTDAEKFPAAGGDYDNSVDGAPGTFDISKADNVEYLLTLPQDKVSLIDGAASLMHMMNANTFTCGAFHPAKAEDADTLAQTLRDAIQDKQWMCGFPDKLVVAKTDGYVMSLYGDQELVDTFRDKLAAAWTDTEVVFDEAIQ